MTNQKFGGSWTEEKLTRVEKYLRAYTTIMSKRSYKFAYIDAFAGTGYRNLTYEEPTDVGQTSLMFPELADQEYQSFADGSARIALRVSPRFDKYIFIEKDPSKSLELENLKQEFPDKAKDISIINEDANTYLQNLLRKKWIEVDRRAVLFLDPFGMQIPWETIELISQTQAIDLWYLFPIGIAVNRLLKRDGNIKQSIREKLNLTFGSEDWFDTFYRIKSDSDLFGNIIMTEKTANFEILSKYFINRLKSIFPGVADNPLLLRNSTNTPLYLLCFATSNERAVAVAIKIAQDILKR